MSGSPSVIVIGGGIVGLCTAYELARRGACVTLVERGNLDDGASHGNAGIIALGHPPLPRPGLVWKTIKWMLNKGSPLYVPPRVDFALMSWMYQFHRACTPQHFEKCMVILAQLGWETGTCWDRIVDEERIECEYHRTGWMDIFKTEEGKAHGLHDAELLHTHGYSTQWIDGAELRTREPAYVDEVIGAVHYTDSRFAHPGMFVRQLAERVKKNGVDVRANTEISRIEVRGDRFHAVHASNGESMSADHLVIAAGVWTDALASSIGVHMPMQAGKGYHLMLTPPSPCLSTAAVLNETYVAVTPMGGGLRLAGTVELSGVNHRKIQRRLDMLIEGARKYLRGIDACTVRSEWCGLRPCTADGLPVIDRAPGIENAYLAAGHAKYGFAYGPVTGKLMSELVLDGRASLDISALRADRFGRVAARKSA